MKKMINRDEAVQKIAKVGLLSVEHAEDLYDSIFEKPAVPQYVADWYEEHKDSFEESLFQCIHDVEDFHNRDESKDFKEWLSLADTFMKNDFKAWMSQAYKNGAVTTLINMHQFGYEVEEDPRYTVRIRNLNVENRFLSYNNFNDKWLFSERYISNDSFRITHTRKDLEDGGFDWVFDCEGVEVKEVD